MTNRLPYETKGGTLSEAETLKQLMEYLRLSEEDLKKLSDLAKIKGRVDLATQWKAIAQHFNRVNQVVNHLATNPTKTSVGYETSTN